MQIYDQELLINQKTLLWNWNNRVSYALR